MTAKETVTFTHDVVVHDHNDDIEFAASVGDVKQLSKASAERWLRRGKCVYGEVKAGSADLRKAVDELEKARSRMAAAEQNPEDTKESENARKFLEKKQAAYDQIAGAK